MKRLLSLILAFIVLTALGANAKTLEFTMGFDTMYESGDEFTSHTLENAPYTRNGRTLVPVRIISERFGALVGWDGDKEEVSIDKDGQSIILTIGNSSAIVNGETVALDVAPEVVNGRTMVPLRFISETLKMDVKYISSTEQVLISDEIPVLSINGHKVSLDDYKSIMVYNGYREGGEDKLKNLKEADKLIREIYSATTALSSDGIVPESNYASDVSAELEPFASEIYANKALTAGIAELLENDIFLVEQISGLVNSEDGMLQVMQIYMDNYITAKHILIAFDNHSKTEAKKIATGIQTKLKKGEDFDKLMEEYCEDPGLIQNPDGYNFTRGEMVEEFEETAYSLEENEVSGIVETNYGYHIIKRLPLAEIDYNTAYYIAMDLANEIYNKLLSDSEKQADIIQYKTIDEIAALIK